MIDPSWDLVDGVCTGRSASWCPVHGDCVCPRTRPDGDFDGERMDDPACPLHAPSSSHAEGDDPEPRRVSGREHDQLAASRNARILADKGLPMTEDQFIALIIAEGHAPRMATNAQFRATVLRASALDDNERLRAILTGLAEACDQLAALRELMTSFVEFPNCTGLASCRAYEHRDACQGALLPRRPQ